jgi:UDP-N-acetylglucosamine transferase subunit ALG13
VDQSKSGKTGVKPRVLVAPLDWGLGHATRCIPVIRELLNQGAEPVLAGEGLQINLLKAEFPDLPILPLKGYRVKYARTALGLLWNMVFQAPAILRVIRKENIWLEDLAREQHLDAVISDNRYGLHHPSITCIFMTHQLLIKTPTGGWIERLLQKKNYRYINHFSECWIPDTEGKNNLAGDLSHPKHLPRAACRYIGPLSRFNKTPDTVKKDHLLVMLSGPEPQRTLFENKIIEQVSHYNGTATIVRGLPGEQKLIPSTNMLQFYNHLPSEELNKEIMKAEFVISRSGYSTVMDLATLQKKSILVPTPGQTEQEYLGEYLQQKKWACTMAQKDFSLTTALQRARKLDYGFEKNPGSNNLKEAITSLVASLHL